MNDERARVLVLRGRTLDAGVVCGSLNCGFDVDVFDTVEEAMAALRRSDYHAIFAEVGDFMPLERGLVGQQASLVLNTIGEGVCVIDADGTCRWSNKRLRSFAPDVLAKVNAICRQARGVLASQLKGATCGGEHAPSVSKKFTFQTDGERYFELIASPVLNDQGQVCQVAAVVWDATSGRRLQQKIDAIDRAGRELVRLEGEAISRLAPEERLELLRDKIISYSKELMHFDHFAVRLLDKRTNKLELVITEGLPEEAMEIDLYAQPEGNGISGYVAATGRSYICHDTEKDPRYILGIEHAKSSLTVPLRLHDQVVGVYNIESDEVGSFNEDDRQFAEIFGRYVGLALNILDLLVVERYTTSGRLAEGVVQEVAEPLNEIVTEAQSLMEEYIGDDQMRGRLTRIVEEVGKIRHSLRDVAAGPRAVLGAEASQAEEPDASLSEVRVLIADDEQNIRDTLDSILKRRGCVTTLCRDGYEAIHLIEQEPFDLVLTDIKMPHRNGYEIFAAARRVCESMPVLLMTGFGYDPNHAIVRASQEGLSGVLFKPFRVEKLLEVVHEALSRPRAAPAPDASS